MKIHHGILRNTKIREYGLQSKIARRAHISQASVNYVWTGRRRATAQQAKKLEEAFLHFEIDITKMDLLYEVRDGESIPHFFDRKLGRD